MTDILATIQAKLKAPKDKENTFGKYKYRNAESILRAFKEVQPEDVSLTMSDTMDFIGNRLFLVATVKLHHAGTVIAEAQGAAMHALEKKGMDDAQITGACSSYARKYALCGLFAIDDSTDDPDGKDNRQDDRAKPPPRQDAPPPKADKTPPTPAQIADKLIKRFGEMETLQALLDFTEPDTASGKAWDDLAKNHGKEADRVKAAFDKRKTELEG
jgi:hypothetical protein